MSIQGSTSSSGATSGAGGAAQEKAQQAAGVAQEKAQQVAGQARGQLSQQVDQRSTQAGEQVVSAAQDVRKVSDTLREQGQERPAQWAEQVAQRVESLGEYLRNSDGDRILHDVEDFGRRQPLAVAGGGLLLGLMASRFLKASSSRRYESRSTGTSAYPPRTGSRYPAYTNVPASTSSVGTGDFSAPATTGPARDVSLTGGVLPDEPNHPDFR